MMKGRHGLGPFLEGDTICVLVLLPRDGREGWAWPLIE